MNLKLTGYKNKNKILYKILQIKSADVLIAKREIQLIKQKTLGCVDFNSEVCQLSYFEQERYVLFMKKERNWILRHYLKGINMTFKSKRKVYKVGLLDQC